MGGAYGIGHAACLAAQLPGESRAVAAVLAAEGDAGGAQGDSMTIEEYDDYLSRPRKEVRHGG